MGCEAKVSGKKLRRSADLEARAVAVMPRIRRVNDNFAFEFKFALAAEGFLQDASLDRELVFVGGVLVVAAAATLEVGAVGRNAAGRWREHFVELGAGEAGLLLGEGRSDGFVFEGEGDEDGFAFALRDADRSVRARFSGKAS